MISQYHRSEAPYHLRRVVFQAAEVGALTFDLEVAQLSDIDIWILHGCLVSLLYKILGRRAYRFEHERMVAKIRTSSF